MRRVIPVELMGWLLLGLFCSRVMAAGPVPMRLDLYPRGGVAELTFLSRVMGVYQYGSQELWPYVSAMGGWGGVMVLGDEGEWRGVGLSMEVDGVLYGVEGEGRGRQRVGAEMARRVGQVERGRYVAQLEHGVVWQAVEGEVGLEEERRVRFVIEPGKREVAMEWVSEFRGGREKGEVVLSMGAGEGLRVQLVPGFSGVVLKGSGGQVWEGAGRGEGEWVVVRGELDGRVMSLVFFGGAGRDGVLVWEARGEQGLRLCLRPGAGVVPERLARGDRWTLKYWMVLRLGDVTAEQVGLMRREAASGGGE